MKHAVRLLIVFVLLTGVYYVISKVSNKPEGLRGIGNNTPQTQNQIPLSDAEKTTIVAENLDTPWGIAFLPDGNVLVTERPGSVRLVKGDDSKATKIVADIDGVKEIGEGGLLGIDLHPDFHTNSYVYLYYTYGESGGQTLNRVVRMKFVNNQLSGEETIVDAIPGASNHNGGRIKFGPDGLLYITTGDAQDPSRAQDKNSLAGKILRVTDDGKAAPGNPFSNPVYSWGHRNPQGIAWDQSGKLWETEHGRSGIQSGLDEVNLIESGKNYGWEIIQGDQARDGMVAPVRHSGNDTWAPGGAAFIGQSLFFGGLRGQALYEAVINGIQVSELKEHFKGEFGRIREVIAGPVGSLYITTSNNDGRGRPQNGDDKIIRINTSKL